jgi:hypothetical protein
LKEVLFGSIIHDAPDRWLADFAINIKEEVRPLILKENATPVRFA